MAGEAICELDWYLFDPLTSPPGGARKIQYMRNKLRLLATLGLSGATLLSACAGEGSSSEPLPKEARIYAASAGQPLTAPSGSAAISIVSDLLAARGANTTGLQVAGQARSVTTGLTHVRLAQEVAGLRVHGAYVKATLDDQGQVMHAIENLAPVRGQLAAAKIDAQGALAAALSHLGYERSDMSSVVARRGSMTTFARSAVFYREPSVERVAFVDDAGALREGFVAETWSLKGNQLDYTLVDGNGRVVSSERRTNNDRYNVYVEDPLKGGQTVVSGPSGSTESPSGWLGTGAQTTINITGNNAHAYTDADANNAPDSGGAAVTSGDFLTAANLAVAPSTTDNKAVAVQNLFYLNNVVHDTLYRHGFDEVAGNFQTNNFGKGGAGNDSVNAEAQDGSGTDNANFSTPNDGSAPRMQMYLWTGASPDSAVTVGGKSYGAYASSGFGAALTTTGFTGALAVYNDGTGVASDGCEASTVALTGKVAIIDRGTCNFTVKVLNAQTAGAIGVIIANNTGTDEASAPGGTDRKVKISSVMVSLNSGAALKTQAGASAQVRKTGVAPLQIDGDIDSDVVFHEYGHGLTWRMIGSMSGKLAGAIGEGASDVVAFLINGDDRIGEYAFSSPLGIRRQAYDTYVGTYSTVTGAEVHNDGEIYAAAMWDVRRNYLAAGLSIDTVFGDFVRGMNYTPATPAYENMRDGMLQAAAGTGRECLIWRAFAKRGIGVGAKGTVARSGSLTITESFALPPTCP